MSGNLGEEAWGCRELSGLALVFGVTLLAGSMVFSGLYVAKLDDETKACRLLDVAMQEADMSEGWYIEAGKVLGGHCGIKEAPAEAERKACFARRAHDAAISCE